MSENMTTSPTPETEGFWNRIIAILSCVVVVAVAFLIPGPRPNLGGSLDVSGLPFVNMALNATPTVLLLVAFALIKVRRINAHKITMLAAFGTSSAFLVSYVIYHWFKAGPRRYEGPYVGLYYVVLISHIILAMGVLPLALTTLYRGWTRQDARHRTIARITLPIWLYVSVTGVIIYLMLYG
ncbi:MAG: DUF420 domain-containing protein [Pirellulales bacterium]|nr:DUF420 domain-containing protein [Pirellulales bacterium]